MTKIVAECECCAETWSVPVATGTDPGLLEGVCMDCQDECDVERPLTFRHWSADRDIEYDLLEILPKGWLAEDVEELTDEEAEAIEEAEDPRGFYEKEN